MNNSINNFSKPPQEKLNNLLKYYQTGRYVDAEKLSLSITEEFPKHPFAWKVLALVLKQNEKINESLIAIQKSVQLEPRDSNAHYNLGIILQELGRLDEAETSYRKTIELKPDYFVAHNNLGNILRELGRLDEAETSCKKAITLKPEYAEAYSNLGNTLKELAKLNEAETSYRKAIALKPEYAEAHNNLGVTLKELGDLEDAETSFNKAIELEPEYASAYSNLGNTLQELGRLDEAETSYRKAIALKPKFTEAHFNLGNTLKELEKFNEAESSFNKAIALKPKYAEAHSNLGVTLKELGDLEDAETSFNKAIALKPEYAEAHNNLGVTLKELGELKEAESSFNKAIEFEPEYVAAWNNLFFLLKTIQFQDSSVEYRLPLLDKKEIKMNAKISKSILNYRLNQGSPSTDKHLKEALNILSTANNTVIKNPKLVSSELIKPTLPEKITALVHFGRSGTGLMHSLIDGHPEVSTLPSVYFAEFFDHFTWEKITVGGWEEMVDRFVTNYEVLFDASSSSPITTRKKKKIFNIGLKEGMMNVGKEKNEVLSVDKKVFVKELKQLMSYYDELDALTFFKLVHSAYDRALHDHNEKKIIFYHIHNPDIYAQLNYLRLAPNTKWLIMVREPLTNCESYISKYFNDNDYMSVSSTIYQMLFQIDQSIYQNTNSVGVKLEDLKKHPKKTIPALCEWLGIKEEDSLYEMTAQGKRWWGDPSGKNYEKDGMDPFGKSSINRKLGSVFSKSDQYILSTLFYPFSVSFGYAEENLKKFKNDLQTIRPMLDQMFDFEKKIVQNKKMNTEKFMKSGSYLFLRSGMIERWNTLNKLHTYPNILTILNIN